MAVDLAMAGATVADLTAAIVTSTHRRDHLMVGTAVVALVVHGAVAAGEALTLLAAALVAAAEDLAGATGDPTTAVVEAAIATIRASAVDYEVALDIAQGGHR